MKRPSRRNLLIMLSIIGPGIITSMADNDAGGIITYAQLGASYGYQFLWIMFVITIFLVVVQEMAARMGVFTGKGLSDLIREHFGVRWTVFAMVVLLIANAATIIAEFAGIAAGLSVFHIPPLLSVPVAALGVWLLVIRGPYTVVERVFFVLSLFFATYIISGFILGPNWGQVAQDTFKPTFHFESNYLFLLVAAIGTTITPWMQFYIQASIVDKDIAPRHYAYERMDVIVGSFLTDFVSFFIIITTAAALYGRHTISSVEDAATALAPVAGHNAEYLFAIGLVGASVLAASVLPLSTSYAICEAFGWEMGISKKLSEAPVFFGLYTALLVFGGVMALLLQHSFITVMLVVQDVNGILIPIVLVFMLILINNKRLMGDQVNSRGLNVFAWIIVGATITATALMLLQPVFAAVFHLS